MRILYAFLFLLSACTVYPFEPDAEINGVLVDWGGQTRDSRRLYLALEACEHYLSEAPGGVHGTVVGSGARIKFVPADEVQRNCVTGVEIAGCYWLDGDLVIAIESDDVWTSEVCHAFGHRGHYKKHLNVDYAHANIKWWARVSRFYDLAD